MPPAIRGLAAESVRGRRDRRWVHVSTRASTARRGHRLELLHERVDVLQMRLGVCVRNVGCADGIDKCSADLLVCVFDFSRAYPESLVDELSLPETAQVRK